MQLSQNGRSGAAFDQRECYIQATIIGVRRLHNRVSTNFWLGKCDRPLKFIVVEGARKLPVYHPLPDDERPVACRPGRTSIAHFPD